MGGRERGQGGEGSEGNHQACRFSSSLATDSRWTSSGPSARRRVRDIAQW